MTLQQLERRLTKLEKLVSDLTMKSDQKPRGGWRKSLGRFADDPVFEEIVRRGRQYRQSLKPKRIKH